MSGPVSFTISNIDDQTSRLDVQYYDPRYIKTMKTLKTLAKKKGLTLMPLGEMLDPSSDLPLTGGATPPNAIYIDEGVKFIRVQNVGENQLNLDIVVYIDVDTHESLLSRSKLKFGDVLLTITGSYGISCVVPKGIGQANINQHCVRIRTNRKIINPYFLSFFLNSIFGRHQMDRLSTGSSRPALDYPSIESILVVVPSMNDQRKIVRILNSMVRTTKRELESANRHIGKEDGKLLKALGISLKQKPKTLTFIAKPDAISDRLDAIHASPYYYEVVLAIRNGKYDAVTLSPNHATVRRRNLAKKDRYPHKLYRLIELDDIDGELGTIRKYSEMLGIDLKGSVRLVEANEIVISRLRYYLRKVAIIPPSFGVSIASEEIYSLKCNAETNPIFLKAMLRHRICVEQAEHRITGSSRPRVDKTTIENLFIPKPPIQIQERIAKIVMDIQSKVERLREEASKLTEDIRKKTVELIESL